MVDIIAAGDMVERTRASAAMVMTLIQQFKSAFMKENIKAGVTGPLWGEATGHQWIPLTKGQ